MRYIGKLDGLPVYEFKRGAYVIVNPDDDKVVVSWSWYGNLGKNYDTFEKGGENPEDDKCIEVIENNKDKVIRMLEKYDKMVEDEEEREFLDAQDKFYDSLEDGKTFDYFSGDYI